MESFVSNSPKETQRVAAELAKKLTGGEIIAFTGGLGAGKTCFVRGLAEGLGYKGDVTSPTFALINEYRGGRLDLFHFDMYRVTGWEDLYSTGFFEYLEYGGVVAVEWSENIAAALDGNKDVIYIDISNTGENSRSIIIKGDKI